MKASPEIRHTATLLFADIEGYTALMQKDEPAALVKLNKFNQIIQQEVPAHNGQIVQFYGDGCLCKFDTPQAAIAAAQNIQLSFLQSPTVPVRIGLHIGEIVEKAANIYGTTVNVTSRIESLSIPGAILLSKPLYEALKHQGLEVSIKDLGSFVLKNVAQPLSIYALNQEGLVLPTRNQLLTKSKQNPLTNLPPKWLQWAFITLLILFGWSMQKDWLAKKTVSNSLTDKKVAVLIFENQTQDESWTPFGTMASDWITQGFMESGASSVISAASIIKNTSEVSVNKASIGNYVQENGAEVLVRGRYYLLGDVLNISANIVDANSGKIYHSLAPISGPKTEAMALLNKAKQAIIGYWAISQDNKDWMAKNPPSYDAYETYIKYLQTWGRNRKKTEETLIKAHQIDPTFYLPLLKLTVLYTNRRQFVKADSMIQLVKRLDPPFTDYEQLRFQAIEASFQNDYLKAGELYRQTLRQFKVHGDNAGSNFLWANEPQKAIATFESYLNLDKLRNCYVCQWDFARLLEANINVKNYHRVLELVDPIKAQVIDAEIIIHYITALSRLDKQEEVEAVIQVFQSKDLAYNGVFDPALFRYAWMVDLYMNGQEAFAKKQAKKLLAIVSNQPNLKLYGIYNYNAAIILEDYQLAVKEAENWHKKIPSSGVKTTISFCYLKLNQLEKAQPWIDQLATIDYVFDRGLADYNQAKLKTALNQKSEAVNLLKSAFAKGLKFSRTNYNGNPLFKNLQGFPTYEKFIRPKEAIINFSSATANNYTLYLKLFIPLLLLGFLAWFVLIKSSAKQEKSKAFALNSPQTLNLSIPSTTHFKNETDLYLEKTQSIIQANLETTPFGPNELAKLLGTSRTQLHRKLKKITGLSTSNLINKVRLAEAKKLLVSTNLTISEIAYAVGYSSLSYFTKNFTKEFQKSPSEFRGK